MKTSDFIRKFRSSYFWGNIAAMVIVVAVACIGLKVGLDIYTHHGEVITIPNIKHKSIDDARHILENLGLELQVSDTGYVKTLPPGCILELSPAAGEKVKSGHIVRVIINAAQSPTLTLPDIIDNSSLREAMAKLSAMGFKLTQPQFVPGEKDWVYGILVGERHVMAGDRISIDDPITIQVGNGQLDAADSIDLIDSEEVLFEDEGDVDEFQEVTGPTGNEQE